MFFANFCISYIQIGREKKSKKNGIYFLLNGIDIYMIQLTLYPQKDNRDISDIPSRHSHFTNMTEL
jgi:hypothetical protein